MATSYLVYNFDFFIANFVYLKMYCIKKRTLNKIRGIGGGNMNILFPIFFSNEPNQ